LAKAKIRRRTPIRKYGGPKYGYKKEKEAINEIRKVFPRNKYIIVHIPGGKGPADYKVYNKRSDGSKGKCVAVIQVKSSSRIGGASYSRFDRERLLKSAARHSPVCVPYFLLLERGKPRWVHARTGKFV